MITEIVWSPIKDMDKKNINNSPIWKQCWKDGEQTEEDWRITDTWYRYTVKFDGLKAVHCTNMKIERRNRGTNIERNAIRISWVQ